MARRNDIQYIRYYAPGSSAHALDLEQPKPRRRQEPKPQPVPQPKKQIMIQPASMIGTLVALILIGCIFSALAGVMDTSEQITRMEMHLTALQSDRYALERAYESGYDLEEIRTAAEAMGMVPVEQVKHVTIHIPVPEPVVEQHWWERAWENFMDMIE